MQWLSYVGSTDFRAVTPQARQLSQQYHAQAWVVDGNRLGTVAPRDLAWAE